jgi:hypothetical protein
MTSRTRDNPIGPVPWEREFSRHVHDHEVLLNFNSDNHAAVFFDWIHSKEIWQKFIDYYKERHPNE